MSTTLALLLATALTDYPRDARKAPAEDPSMDPIAVCKAMVAASKAQDIDTFIGFTTSYARKNFDAASRLAVRESRIVLKEVICVRVSKEDDAATPPTADVWIYAPNKKSRNMPFLRENGFWRLDWDKYWHSSGGDPTK